MKYREKPAEIEAVQFTRRNWDEITEFTGGKAKNFTIERRPYGKCYCHVVSEIGAALVNEGDFIVMTSSGFFKPIPERFFLDRYEVAE